jgi:flagellar motor switch protein FliN
MQVPVIVKLAERRLQLSEVMRLGAGAIIEFSKRSDEPLELLVNNKAIAAGETVKVGENFGLRITQVREQEATVEKVGRLTGEGHVGDFVHAVEDAWRRSHLRTCHVLGLYCVCWCPFR